MILFSPLLFRVPTTQNLGTSMADLLCRAKWVPGWHGAVWHGMVQWGVAWCGAQVASAATCSDGFCCHYPGHCKDWVCIRLALHRIAQHAQTHTHTIFSPRSESQGIPKKCNSSAIAKFFKRIHEASGGQWAPPPGREY